MKAEKEKQFYKLTTGDILRAKTLGELKSSGYKSRSIKEEIRENLIAKIKNREITFPGIVGYDDTVIPETETALLSRHNILFLGLRGQAKTRMARQMVNLLDEYIPVVAGSEINDDPFKPISKYATDLVKEKGDDTPVEWLHRSERYGEKLATPDVSVADLIGDIDPIKAANLKLSFSQEEVLHFGIIPRSNRSIFVINELPDLQARIQVSLFNLLEEGDLQIRGFKLRLPLDILFVFTANPEDYTNRGSIVTPLKDRIQSQILTHYPKNIEHGLAITEQEALLDAAQKENITISPLIKLLIERIAFEARESEYVDRKSGVSARLTISALENAVSAAERRMIINNEQKTNVWISDLAGIFPAITGKIELVYEGEQEGPYHVAQNLIDKAIKNIFLQHFPNPEALKKRKGKEAEKENPFRPVTAWFDKGNTLEIMNDVPDAEKNNSLYSVDGLAALVDRYFAKAPAKDKTLYMELALHGLAAFSLISRRSSDGKTKFSDLMGSMLGMSDQDFDESELE